MGFFDLEMCRVGCAAAQLGSALFMGGRENDTWDLFLEGWEDAVGGPLSLAQRRAAAAFSHFLNWRWISRYLSYDGTPGTGFHWADPAEPMWHRKEIVAANEMLMIET